MTVHLEEIFNYLITIINGDFLKEVELCFRIDSEKEKKIQDKLKEFFVKKVTETDTYFFPPHKDFFANKNGKENLRIRDSNGKVKLTYKNVVYNNWEYSHSIEKTVTVNDSKELIEILKSLGFKIHITIVKEREIFENDKFKITIDKIEDLGFFAEIEWNCEENENALEECKKMAKELELEEIEDKGYLRLLEEKMDLK
ncbi:MAG: class IV adenylate cyclase [Candidatus Aenigmarchaeota archaeon]|nr:class IV adenylate cyclase [Candidatus Aenigmarchaeota archaeon]